MKYVSFTTRLVSHYFTGDNSLYLTIYDRPLDQIRAETGLFDSKSERDLLLNELSLSNITEAVRNVSSWY